MKKIRGSALLCMIAAGMITGCANVAPIEETQDTAGLESSRRTEELVMSSGPDSTVPIVPGTEITRLEPGLSAVRYDGDYWFDIFLEQGGASSDSGVIDFLTGRLQMGAGKPAFQTNGFGCSTLAVKSPEGEALFGRNFDWENCEAMIVRSNPSGAYASVSTVNMDFIRSGYGENLTALPDEIQTLLALYAPLDGMNEKGLAVSVNMIQDSDTINQDTGKPDLTTTTAIRMLLDKAASVDEALKLLEQYDLHSSMGMMVHFALADRSGRSVAVEYIHNNMVVTDTPVLTNFYLAEGDKQGIGTSQSHTRYEILMERLSQDQTMDMEQVRDTLDSVSKDNFGEFESTEWSIVFQLDSGEARYYHRENYGNSYTFHVGE